MILVAETLADQPLRYSHRDLSNLPAKVVLGSPNVMVDLRPSGFYDARGLLPSGLHKSPLLLCRLAEGGLPDGLGLGMRGFEFGPMLLLLALGFRSREPGLFEGLLDGLGPLLHYGQKRPVEEPPKNEEQKNEIDRLNDQGGVQVNEPAFCRKRARGQETEPDREKQEPQTQYALQ